MTLPSLLGVPVPIIAASVFAICIWALVLALALSRRNDPPELATAWLILLLAVGPALFVALTSQTQTTVITSGLPLSFGARATVYATYAGLLFFSLAFWLTPHGASRTPRPVLALGLAGVALLPEVSSRLNGYSDNYSTVSVIYALVLITAACSSLRPMTWIPRLQMLLLVLVAVSLFVALSGYTLGYDPILEKGERAWLPIGQVAGILFHPNVAALVAVTSALLYLLPVRGRIPTWLGVGASVLLLVLTQSRSGWLAMGFALVAVRATRFPGRPSSGVVLKYLTIGVLLTLGLAPIFVPGDFQYLLSRAAQVGGLGSTGRSDVWPLLLDTFEKSPLLGGGYSVFDPASRSAASGWAHGHNQVLHLAATAGIAGLLALSVAAAALWRLAWRTRMATEGVSLSILLAWLGYSIGEVPLRPSLTDPQAMCIVIGIVVVGMRWRATMKESDAKIVSTGADQQTEAPGTWVHGRDVGERP